MKYLSIILLLFSFSATAQKVVKVSGGGGITVETDPIVRAINGIVKSNGTTIAAAVGSDIPNITESQVTNLVTDLSLKAPLASPTLTGVPAAPTAAAGTNTTQIATTSFVTTAVAGGLTSSNFIYNEVPAGVTNGVNTSFTLANTPVTGKVVLIQSGSMLKLTTYWSISGNTITFVTAPVTGAEIFCNYIK